MKWYFASRTRHRDVIVNISEFLESKGEVINSQWVYEGPLEPYAQNLERAQSLALEVVDAIKDTDIFVLISDPEGTDMFVELGVCLGERARGRDVRIYIVGEHAKRSLMHLHPFIIHTKDVAEVFSYEGIDCNETTLLKFEM